MSNYYDVLGVSLDATEDQIKTAFKKKALAYHPDRNQGDPHMEEQFKEINEAYQTLSNPYEKARYDFKLKYGAQQFTYEPTATSYQSPPPPRPPYARPNYAEPEIDWKQNWKATFYAFVFTLAIALMVLGVVSIKDYYDEQQFLGMLEERRATFDEIVELNNAGHIDPALTKLDQMGGFFPSEEDMAEFKGNLLNSILTSGQEHFQSGQYAEALIYLEMLERYMDIPQITLLEWQAKAYRETDEPRKAVKILTKLLLMGHRSIENYIEMAEIYRDDILELETAKSCFEQANELAKEMYSSTYGNGYAVVISERHVPPIHYSLYTGLADIYLRLGDPQKAIKATRWNIRIWPDRKEAYEINTEAYLALGDTYNACFNYDLAASKGSMMPQPTNCGN